VKFIHAASAAEYRVKERNKEVELSLGSARGGVKKGRTSRTLSQEKMKQRGTKSSPDIGSHGRVLNEKNARQTIEGTIERDAGFVRGGPQLNM